MARLYLRYVTEDEISIGVMDLQNPLGSYLKIGLSTTEATDGSDDSPEGTFFWVTPHDSAPAATDTSVFFTRNPADIGLGTDNDYVIYGFAQTSDGLYWHLDRYINLRISTPYVDVDSVTATSAHLTISNLGCPVGSPSTGLQNEDAFGYAIVMEDATQPTISTGRRVTSWGDATTYKFTGRSYSRGVSHTIDGLAPSTDYKVYYWRRFTSNDGTNIYCIVGADEFGTGFTTFDEGYVAPWSWESSNGDASKEQTETAYNAVEGNGAPSDFSHLVWNDLVKKSMK